MRWKATPSWYPIHRAQDGSLNQEAIYSTGGRGGALTGPVVDYLASEGFLGYDSRHHLLYAVKAGSNTVTVFRVSGDRLLPVQVVPSGGQFPVSVAVHGSVVYVANARAGGPIQGHRVVGDRLLRIPAWNRKLGLPQSAEAEFTHTVGQIGFTRNGSQLIVTTKAAGNSIQTSPIDLLGGPAQKAVTSSDDPGARPLRLRIRPTGAPPGHGGRHQQCGDFYGFPDWEAALTDRVATNQMATCWIVVSGDMLYASNASSGSLSGYQAVTHGPLVSLGNTVTDAGTVDASVSSDGRFVYVQTGAGGVIDAYRRNSNGSLTEIGSVTVPRGIGGEGIVAQ